ncbi:thiol-disulfide oxidoreductase DCC family protein [Halobaculum sp. CBA1158]|uniref:thiol-disulfide oxidoreductase DCC family protein n=1 Tax=Halobaculum sp. CBA1158 TaxID=2904243 RepID=UPI001F17D8DD|nr:thiol-disulfide oxidoreductase DCC family protein [Halobaculum sp. CBA1158]UIP01093.1 thiol-disulfide oxidoreductase DCC family protein [Halobaculum sp. CBA1158]
MSDEHKPSENSAVADGIADGDGDGEGSDDASADSDALGDGSDDASVDSDAPGDGSDDGDATSDSDAADPLADVDPERHPVVLFDGVCNLCHGAIRFLVRHDTAGVFRFAPLESPVGRALLAEHGLPTESHDSFVLVDGDGAHERSTAALRVARRLDSPWDLAWALRVVPRRLRDGAYDLVATYRYRVFGRRDECAIPEPEIRERFAERALE